MCGALQPPSIGKRNDKWKCRRRRCCRRRFPSSKVCSLLIVHCTSTHTHTHMSTRYWFLTEPRERNEYAPDFVAWSICGFGWCVLFTRSVQFGYVFSSSICVRAFSIYFRFGVFSRVLILIVVAIVIVGVCVSVCLLFIYIPFRTAPLAGIWFHFRYRV